MLIFFGSVDSSVFVDWKHGELNTIPVMLEEQSLCQLDFWAEQSHLFFGETELCDSRLRSTVKIMRGLHFM